MKRMRIISKRVLLGCSIVMLCSSSGDIVAISFAEKRREFVKNRIEQLHTTTQNLLKSLDGYKQCIFKSMCTSAQKSNLKKMGAAVGVAVAALLAAAALAVASKSWRDDTPVQVVPDVTEQVAVVGDPKEALFDAVARGDVDGVDKALQAGVNIQTTTQGKVRGVERRVTPLDMAIVNQDEEMVRFLLKNADANPFFVSEEVLRATSAPVRKMIVDAKSLKVRRHS